MPRHSLLYATLAALVVAGSLTACGGSTQTASSPSPIPSMTSPSGVATTTPGPAADLQLKEGVHAILVGLQSWAASQATPRYPAHATAAVLGTSMVDPWPRNPLTGTRMRPGGGPGDYTYWVAADRKSCSVTVRLSDGNAYTPQVLGIQ
ncbi:MAG TPA: hypothetical protein VFD50_07810, partial [Thermoleophilia bacterium]|nr:hypothetical protein [Thermoleophilia bacterium]